MSSKIKEGLTSLAILSAVSPSLAICKRCPVRSNVLYNICKLIGLSSTNNKGSRAASSRSSISDRCCAIILSTCDVNDLFTTQPSVDLRDLSRPLSPPNQRLIVADGSDLSNQRTRHSFLQSYRASY